MTTLSTVPDYEDMPVYTQREMDEAVKVAWREGWDEGKLAGFDEGYDKGCQGCQEDAW